MRYKIMFSLPVHEEPEVVFDLIENVHLYNPECAIVVHISQYFLFGQDISSEEFEKLLNQFSYVYVNPTRLQTKWGVITQCHISNFEYVDNQAEFDYFSMIASNNMFVKGGMVEKLQDAKKAYLCPCKLSSNPGWINKENAENDLVLRQILEDCGGQKDIYMDMHEGTTYQRDVFRNMCSIINRRYDFQNTDIDYPREEIYFPTIANCILNENEIGQKKFCYYNWAADLKVTQEEIQQIQNQTMPNKDLLMVKRIQRKIDDSMRKYIWSLTKKS